MKQMLEKTIELGQNLLYYPLLVVKIEKFMMFNVLENVDCLGNAESFIWKNFHLDNFHTNK